MEHSIVPPCEATGPDGTRLLIRPHDVTDSVADLARALDLPATTPLAIDARRTDPHERLVATGLHWGSAVTLSPEPSPESRLEPPPDVRPRHHSTVPVPTSAGADVAVLVGPACARWVRLAPGRHSVGRAPSASVRVDDPAVELHHAVLDVDADGTVVFTQLTGVFPASVDGRPCDTGHRLDIGSSVSLGASRLAIGRPGFRDGSISGTSPVSGSIVAAESDPWRHVVRRAPAPPVEAQRPLLEVPEPPGAHRAPPLTSLVGAGVAAAGAGVLAAVLGQMLFAVFAAVGAVASVATWAFGALAARRDRRRADAAHRAALATFEMSLREAHADAERRHRADHRDLVDALEVVHGDGGGVWSRRCGPAEALWSTIGRGTCRWAPPIETDSRRRLAPDLLVAVEQTERLVDVAVPLALDAGRVVALSGPRTTTAALVRSVIVQLAADYGPADWRLQVISDDAERWGWATWLPHARDRGSLVDANDPTAVADAMRSRRGDTDGYRTVIVLDATSLLSTRTGPVRRRLESGNVSCIALVAPDASVPAVAGQILEVGTTGGAAWTDGDALPWTSIDREIRVAGLSIATAEAAARRLAPLIDPEDHDDVGGVPTEVSLAELEPVGVDAASAIARRWRTAGRDPAPVTRLGLSDDGIVDVDLARDGPHALIAGTTGSGKSELLRTLVVSLAAQSSPDHVTMILVDFKGGSTFDACERLPHTVGVVTDLDDGLAERVLVSLDAEVRRRERLLRAVGVDDLTGYRSAADAPLPRLVVVIDEFASLAKELPEFLGALVAVAQRGRSLGIHLVLATQRPAGVVTDDIRANTNLRVALRLHDRSDAEDVVGDGVPARFPAGVPGRAALRLGPDELVVFQTASTAGGPPQRAGRLQVDLLDRVGRHPGADLAPGNFSARDPAARDAAARDAATGALAGMAEPSVLDNIVDAITAAAASVATAPPHRPWIDALPDVVHPRDLDDPSTTGLLDDPAGQCRRPLRWTPRDGNLLLVGAVGAGTTTACAAVAAAGARASPPEALHLYVIDAQGESVWSAFEPLAHCGAVVRVSELERLTRLLARLAGELDRRATDGRREPSIVVVIDGFAAVRDALDDVLHVEAATRLDRVLRDGPALGIVAVITTDGSSSRGLAVPRSSTWVFHVADDGVARAAGVRGPVAGPGRPGRFRVVESGLEGHVVDDPEPLRAVATSSGPGDRATGPPPVSVLPEVIDADCFDLRTGSTAIPSSNGRPVELPIGIGADDLEPARLLVPSGDHVFIGGGARTGRSTALLQVEVAWRRAHPDARLVHLDRHHSIEAALADRPADTTPLLVVVDDAERVDDPQGTLARLVAQPGVTFAVAARLEAVRVAYGHWTRSVARGRCGLIMTSAGDIDGELLGATLPRRSPIPPRPGLAWVVDQAGPRLVQVAARMHS